MDQMIRRAALATTVLNVVALLIAASAADAQTANPEPCKNVDASEIDAALGHAATPKMQGGEPKIDAESGARVWMCAGYYTRGEPSVFDAMLMITVHELDTPAAAADVFTAGSQIDDPNVPDLTAQSDVGDAARWGANSASSIWVAQKGRYVVHVMLGQGVNGADGLLPLDDPLKEPLKRLMMSTLAKL